MDMIASYGNIEKPKKNTAFLMILAWLCLFNILHQNRVYDMTIR